MSPTPNTTFFRVAARCAHFTQGITRCRSSAKAAALASGVSAGASAFGGETDGASKDREAVLGATGGADVCSLRGADVTGLGAAFCGRADGVAKGLREGGLAFKPVRVCGETSIKRTPRLLRSSRC